MFIINSFTTEYKKKHKEEYNINYYIVQKQITFLSISYSALT